MDGSSHPQDERDALAVLLDQQRDALIGKLDGVSDADARRVPTVSSLSLLALLKHCAVWEARWLQGVFAGRRLADGWPDCPEDVAEADFLIGDDDTVEVWLGRYRTAIAASRDIAAQSDLAAESARGDVHECNLRWVLLHLIQETARHAGHADIIRESLDGSRDL
jgi:hypothetical protein